MFGPVDLEKNHLMRTPQFWASNITIFNDPKISPNVRGNQLDGLGVTSNRFQHLLGLEILLASSDLEE